jgi:hypothetical protein
MRSDVTHVIDAAVHAAAAGDHRSAESLLREVAARQEADLGPVHPDLATTLNNLAVLCDRTGKVTDAELFYRRAHAIATATLEPEHPFIATTRENLIDFCEARGIPVEAPTPTPAVVTEPEPAITIPRRARIDLLASREPRRRADNRSSRRVATGAVVAFGLVLALSVAARLWLGSNDRANSAPDVATAPRAATPATPAQTPAPTPVDPTSDDKGKPAGRTGSAGEVASRADTAAAASTKPVVATAQLCKTLSTASRTSSRDWQCDPPGDPVDPGSLVFYTRVKSATSTTIQHRWYRGNELRKVVELHVSASPVEGYRTFSRNAVDRRSGGDWKVEVRTNDGVLLQQERFVVR